MKSTEVNRVSDDEKGSLYDFGLKMGLRPEGRVVPAAAVSPSGNGCSSAWPPARPAHTWPPAALLLPSCTFLQQAAKET